MGLGIKRQRVSSNCHWCRRAREVAQFSGPGVFSPVKLDGKTLVDGGLVNPLPIAPTLNDPTDFTIAVNLAGIDQVWQVSFLEYDLGFFDKERDRVEPGPDPFVPDKVLTM